MTSYTVYSVDMWGHVPSDCAEHDCPCMRDGNHDDNRCQCHENMNDRFRVDTIEADSTAAIVPALHEAGLLSDTGRDICSAEDINGMGECIEVRDDVGRLIFYIESEES